MGEEGNGEGGMCWCAMIAVRDVRWWVWEGVCACAERDKV